MISNGYASIDDFKSYHAITSTNAADDGVIEILIESASRYIDNETGQRFYTSTGTHYFDTPARNSDPLILDEELTSISALVNGSGSTFSSTDYNCIPYNSTPYNAIKLIRHPSVGWLPDANGDPEHAIQVNGTWGRSCPVDIRDACVIIAVQAYHRRFGDKAAQDSIIMPSGMVINPAEVPSRARTIINNHRKVGIG